MKEDRKPRVCFVTNELYPLGPGGIGRMLYNFSRHNEMMGSPAELHYLVDPKLVADAGARQRLEEAVADRATIHVAPKVSDIPHPFARSLLRAARQHWTLENLLEVSYGYYIGLLEAERAIGGAFDIIEFPDLGGWGLAIVEAKRAGLAFGETLLSARLHSSRGMIIRAEKFEMASTWNGMVLDAERHLLTHADLVVGHIGALIDENAEHYQLMERWEDRSHLEFPPIMLEEYEAPARLEEDGQGEDADFIFSSRLQWFKRPDIFVRAAIAFLERHPGYRGVFRIVSYGWDTDYIDWIKALVPPSMRGRIEFTLDATPEQRAKLIGTSIVVIPSDYESLCLFAFEVSQLGRKVILNGSCKAFGENPRWQAGENCLMFDGSVNDLVTVMEQAIDWQPTTGVAVAPDRPYWLDPSLISATPADPGEPLRASVSVICMGSEIHSELEDQIAKAVFIEKALDLESGRDELIFLLPRGRYDPQGAYAQRIMKRGWRLEFASGLEECPEMLRARLTGLERDCVLLWPAGFDLHPDYIECGLVAMARNLQVSIFGGHLEVTDPVTGALDTLRGYGGEMPSLAVASGRIAPPISILRRSFLERGEFDPRAGNLWYEDFMRRAALDDESILIPPIIAATLDASKTMAAETTPKLSAGLLDSFGLDNGISARLIGLEIQAPASTLGAEIFRLPDAVLLNARRVAPQSAALDFDPVRYFTDKGLMVHPLEDAPVTIAELTGPPERMQRLGATIANTSAENQGIEAAAALIPHELSLDRFLALLDSPEPMSDGVSLSPWVRLEPGQEGTVDLYVSGASSGNDRILLMSRLPAGAGEANAHLIFSELRSWPLRRAR